MHDVTSLEGLGRPCLGRDKRRRDRDRRQIRSPAAVNYEWDPPKVVKGYQRRPARSITFSGFLPNVTLQRLGYATAPVSFGSQRNKKLSPGIVPRTYYVGCI